MQISRHWRLNMLRYRLQGVRYENGEVSLQDRPQIIIPEETEKLHINQDLMRDLNPSGVGVRFKEKAF